MSEPSFFELCNEAREAVARKDLAGGRRLFVEAVKLKPDDADAIYGLGTVCFLLRDHAAAQKYFLEVQRLDPQHAGAAINLGAIYNLAGKYDEAIEQLRKGIKLDPKRAQGFYNLGIAYRKIGKNDLAIQAYREASHINPRMIEAIYNLANLYLELERFDQAVNYYKKALEVKPDFAKAREGLERAEKGRSSEQASSTMMPIGAGDSYFYYAPQRDQIDDRPLDPATDAAILTSFHEGLAECFKYSDQWRKLTLKLSGSFRDLLIGLTSDAPIASLRDTLEAFRENVERFRSAERKIGRRCDKFQKMRDKLVQ